MSPATFRLVLLVSCCHGLVHIYEHSFASVEQLVGQEFGVGKETTGLIGSCLRLPFGLFALAAGWMADRWGARRLLLVYVGGCACSSLLAWFSPGLAGMFLAMFLLGVFAGIYHPAGVGWIAQHTQPDTRPLALGYHGILGSAGIAAGPFLAALVFDLGVGWRGYYLILGLLGWLLAWGLSLALPREEPSGQSPDGSRTDSPGGAASQTASASAQPREEDFWWSFWILSAMTSLAGMVYAAITTFLPRYLDETGLALAGVSRASMRTYQTGFVLVLGILGQYTAGRIGRPKTLEPLIALAFALATPCVVWMGFAQGPARLAAAGLFAVLFFAHQPLYNSAVAKYVVGRRRGLAYGVSFTLGFGIGSLGPALAGQIQKDEILYPVLAGILALAALLAALLWLIHRPAMPEAPPAPPPSDEGALL